MMARLRDTALGLWLLLAAVAIFVPFSPGMPSAGLDAAWVLGLNEATARGLAFGRELIFTYGPYSAVYTRAYHPGTYALTLAASLYLGLSYAAALVLLMRLRPQRWNLALLALLCGTLWFLRDPVILSLPLAAAIGVAHLAAPRARWHLPAMIGLFAPLGLLPLVKGSVGILCLGIVAMSAALLLIRRRPTLAAACVLTPVVSMLLFWRASGQAVADLPGYFIHMLPIVSGYTEAMSVMGDNRQALAFVVACVFMLWMLADDGRRWRETGLTRLYLLGAFGLFLFMSFKGIYGRHDLWRGLSGGTTLLVAALLLRSASARRRFWPVLLVAVLGFAYIDRKGFTTPGLFNIDKLTDSYAYAWREWRARSEDPRLLQRQYADAMAALKASTPLLPLPGSVDLYPAEQGALIASGNRWNPRPILQSYSAYVPLLAELNRQHLLGADAPAHLYFKVDSIDERVPSLDDGPSWPTLLQRYRPEVMQGEYLVLDRLPPPAAVSTAAPTDATASGAMSERALGEWVDVPGDRGALMVRMDIRPTLYGRLALWLFKPSQLRIDLELADGKRLNYRLVSTMARAGFLLSPLVQNTSEFAMLYGDPALLAGSTVRRLRVQPLLGPDRIWQHRFGIGYSPLPGSKPVDLSALLQASLSFAAPADAAVVMAEQCDGSIDLLDGASPQRPPAVNNGSRWISAAGWLAESVEAGSVPGETYLVFEAADGTRRFAATHNSQRPDVAAYFRRPGLAPSGWNARVDITGLQGRFNVGLAYRTSRTIEVCAEGRVLIDLPAAGTATRR